MDHALRPTIAGAQSNFELWSVKPQSPFPLSDFQRCWLTLETEMPPDEARKGRSKVRGVLQPGTPLVLETVWPRHPQCAAGSGVLCGRGTTRWRSRSPGFRDRTGQLPPGRCGPRWDEHRRSPRMSSPAPRGKVPSVAPQLPRGSSVLAPRGGAAPRFFPGTRIWEGRLPGSRCLRSAQAGDPGEGPGQEGPSHRHLCAALGAQPLLIPEAVSSQEADTHVSGKEGLEVCPETVCH